MMIQQQPPSLSDRPQVSSLVKTRRSVSPAEPPYRLAQALVEQEKWEDAITAYQQALTITPNWVEVQRELGDLFLKLERWDEAIEVYETAISLRSDTEVYHNLGDALLKLQRWEDGVAAYQKAIELNPEFSWSYNNLGDGLRELQRWDEAAQAYQKAIELKPDFALSHHNLGDVLVKKEEWERAIAAYRAVIKLAPNLPQVYEKLGDALQHQIQSYCEEISQVYHRAVADNPTNLEVYYKALEVNPKDAEMSLKLADTLRNQGKLEQAVTFYKSTLQIESNNPEIQTVAMQKLDDVLQELGHLEEVEKSGNQSVVIKSRSREIVALAKDPELKQFYSDLVPLIIFGNGESIDVVSRNLFLCQNYTSETGLHIIAVPSHQCEVLKSDKSLCNSLVVLANNLKNVADHKSNIPGGYWKILQINSESLLLSIFLEPGKFMMRENFADILKQFQSFGSSSESEFHFPSLDFLISELLEHRGDAYIESIESILDKMIDHISSSARLQRRSIEDLLNVLMFSPNIDSVQAKLHNYLNKTVNELKVTIDDSRKERLLCRQIDSCLYLAFELSGKNCSEALTHIFNQAFDQMLSRRIPALILLRGLRHSFLKAIEFAQYIPRLIDMAEITYTDDSIVFLAIHKLMWHKSINTESEILKTWLLLKKIFELPKKNLISLVRDLRRSVPSCPVITVSLFTEIISTFEITGQKTPDRETALAKCLLLLYANCFDLRLLNWMGTHYKRIGITSEDKDILLALAGYDIPLIVRFNQVLLEEGFKYKILCPCEYSTITDYMKANLVEWAKHRQSYLQPYTGDTLPLISVIFTTFNPDLKLLRLSLESIIEQTYPALEIIIIDDHSPSESSQALNSLVSEMLQNSLHPIVYQRNEKNVGQYVSRNIAIAIAKGQFIAIQDDDDISHPERLQHQLEPMLNDSKVIATHTNHLRISENSRLMVDGDALGELLGDAPVSFVWRKRVFYEIGFFLPTKTRGDIEFRSRMRRYYSDQAIKFIAQPLVLMRGGMGTVSSSKEYYFRSALKVWRYMINHIPLEIDGSDKNNVDWIPTVLR